LQKLLCLLFLGVVTFFQHLIQDAACTIAVTHIDIGFGQIKLSADFVYIGKNIVP